MLSYTFVVEAESAGRQTCLHRVISTLDPTLRRSNVGHLYATRLLLQVELGLRVRFETLKVESSSNHKTYEYKMAGLCFAFLATITDTAFVRARISTIVVQENDASASALDIPHACRKPLSMSIHRMSSFVSI